VAFNVILNMHETQVAVSLIISNKTNKI